MSDILRSGAQSLFAAVRRIKTRTWVMIGLFLTLLMGLALWAVIAVFGALWGGTKTLLQSTGITATSVQDATAQASAKAQALLDAAQQKIEQVKTTGIDQAKEKVQGAQAELAQLGEQAKAVAAAPIAEASAQLEAAQQASAIAIATAVGVAAGLPERPISSSGSEVSRSEVSGEDFGPERFPGLARTTFSRNGDALSAVFEGNGEMTKVLAHYRSAFLQQGYREQVLEANARGERHRFERGNQRIELGLSKMVPGESKSGLRLTLVQTSVK